MVVQTITVDVLLSTDLVEEQHSIQLTVLMAEAAEPDLQTVPVAVAAGLVVALEEQAVAVVEVLPEVVVQETPALTSQTVSIAQTMTVLLPLRCCRNYI